MSVEQETIDQLIGDVIVDAKAVHTHASWFDIQITTAKGYVITSGGYSSDAGATLKAADGTVITEWGDA